MEGKTDSLGLLKIATLNCERKINTTILSIINQMKDDKIDILMLQEVNTLNRKAKTVINMHHKGKFEINRNPNHTNEAGVMMLIRDRPDLECKVITNLDKNGRLQMAEICFHDRNLRIINVYAPNKRPNREAKFQEIMTHLEASDTIIGGDMNFIEDAQLDLSCIAIRAKRYENIGSDTRETMKDTCGISDLWRHKNPYLRVFSRLDRRGTSTRLDRIYGSPNLLDNIQKGEYIPNCLSDHSLHYINLKGL